MDLPLFQKNCSFHFFVNLYIIRVYIHHLCPSLYRMLICGHWCVQYVHSVVTLCTTVYSMLIYGHPSVLVCTICTFCGCPFVLVYVRTYICVVYTFRGRIFVLILHTCACVCSFYNLQYLSSMPSWSALLVYECFRTDVTEGSLTCTCICVLNYMDQRSHGGWYSLRLCVIFGVCL